MTLNKLLCKYFDKNKTGIVTVGDVGRICFDSILTLFGILIIGYCVIQGIYLISDLLDGSLTEPIDELTALNCFLGTIGLLIIIVIVSIIIYKIFKYVSHIEIAKCDR